MNFSSFECRYESIRFEGTVAGRARILHMSDLHLWGLPWESSRLARWREKIVELVPDAIIITGDLADTKWGMRSLGSWLMDVSQISPVYFIRGNHDRASCSDALADAMNGHRIYDVDASDHHLSNENGYPVPITTWERWVKSPTKNAIVLTHNPRSVTRAAVVAPVLILAGHLHGGQWVLWRDRDGAGWPPALFYPWCGDRWNLGEGVMIVSRGLGDTMPIRLRCPRELVLIDVEFFCSGSV